jgi:hypothetical protein
MRNRIDIHHYVCDKFFELYFRYEHYTIVIPHKT